MAEKLKLNEMLKVFNPFQYKNLLRHRKKYLFNIYFIFLVVALALFTIVLLPKTFYIGHNVKNAINSFDELSIDVNATHQERLSVSKFPEIVIDLNNASNVEGNIMITNDDLYLDFWPIKKQSNLNDFANLRDRSDSLSKVIGLFALLIFPGILISIGLFYLIESLLIACIFTLLGFVVVRVIKRDLILKRLFKIAILSAPILFIFNSVFIPTILNLWFPIIIYFMFFIMSAIVCSHRIGFKATERPIKGKNKSSSRTKQIFGKPKVKKDEDDFIMLD